MNSDPTQSSSVSSTAAVVGSVVNKESSSDYLDSTSVIIGAGVEHKASHVVRIVKDSVTITDSQEPGELVFSQDICPEALDAVAAHLAKQYEHYSIKQIDVAIEATSPFGVSSGGMQVGWITDPQNAALPQASTAEKLTSLEKMVRQEQSKLIRPRNSENLIYNPAGKRYCIKGADTRLSSYGTIAGVIRAPPGTGDSCSFAVTISVQLDFYRACLTTVDYFKQLVVDDFTLDREIEIKSNVLNIDVKIPISNGIFDVADVVFSHPLHVHALARSGRYRKQLDAEVRRGSFHLLEIKDDQLFGHITIPIDGFDDQTVRSTFYNKPKQMFLETWVQRQ